MMGPVPCLFRFMVLLMAFWLPVGQGWSAEGEAGRAGGLALELRVGKSPIHVGEKVEISATLLVARAGVRNIGYPTLASPAGTLSAFSPPTREPVHRAGQDIVSYRFEASFQPDHPGRFDLGPAELVLAVPASTGRADAFFGGDEERTLTVRSNRLSLTVSPLPMQGRPPEFSGAVGRYDIRADVAPRSLRVGQPFTLTTRIRGVGGFDKLICPKVEPDGARAYPPRVVKSGVEMVCEQVLLALGGARIEIPPLRIAYFNPATGRYEVASSNPAGVEVIAGPESVEAPKAGPPGPQKHTVAGKADVTPNIYSTYLILAGVLFILAATLAARKLGWLGKARLGQGTVESAPAIQTMLEEAEKALSRNDMHDFYLALFRACQYLAARCSDRPPPGIASADPRLNAHQLGDGDIPPVLEALLRECDAVRYGLESRDAAAMRRALEEAKACRGTPHEKVMPPCRTDRV